MKITIEQFEKGLLFQKGQLIRTLSPGRYRIWRFWKKQRVIKVDTRLRTFTIQGQEIMTADKVTLRMNVLVQFQIANAADAILKVESYKDQLYFDAQLSLRRYIVNQTMDELLKTKVSIESTITQEIREKVAAYGLDIVEIGIKDLILPGDMKDIFNQVIQAQKRAEAAAITRREEVATVRTQLNTAQLYEKHPALARLRDLEVLEHIYGTAQKMVIMNSPEQILDSILKKK